MNKAEQVYQRLINPIESRMIAIIGRIIRDPEEAADVMQEVLAVIWAKLHRIDRHPNPHAYILRICISRSYDALRRRIRRRRHEIQPDQDQGKMLTTSPRPALEREETTIQIHAAIAGLPDKQGQAVMLRIIEQSSYESLSEILNCSAATARSHVSKGLQSLRKKLSEIGIV